MNIRSFNPKFWILLLVTAQTGVVLPAIATSSETSPTPARSSVREMAFDLNVTDLEGTTLSENTTESIVIADRGNDRDVDFSVDFDRR